jgi:intracellular septation protein A
LKGTSYVIAIFFIFCSPINVPVMSVFSSSQFILYIFFLVVSLPYPASPP